MISRATLVGMLLLCPLIADSQVYTLGYGRAWGGSLTDGFTDVAMDASGNSYAVGFASLAANNVQLLVVKYSPTGSILWSRTNVSEVSAQDAHVVLTGSGDVCVVHRRFSSIHWDVLSAANGSTLANRSESVIDARIDDVKFHAPSSAVITMFQGSPSSSQNQYRLLSLSASSLAENWDKVLAGTASPSSKIAVSADGSLYAARNGAISTRTQKIEPLTGNIVWTVDHPHTQQSSFDIKVLNGTLNPIITPSNTSDGVVKTLNKSTGATVRTDTFSAPVVAVMPGLSATYTASTQSSFNTHLAVFPNGGQMGEGSAAFQVGAFVTDESGQPHAAGFIGTTPDNLSDLGFRHPGSGSLGLTPRTFESGAATAADSKGNRIVAVGNVVDAGNQQARIVLFTINKFASTDGFAYRFNTLLKVPAPGVRMNDSLAHTSTVTLVTPPVHGTLTLFPDGSFDYQPDAGFRGNDRFDYRIGNNATDLARVNLNCLAPLTMNASPGSVMGGTTVNIILGISPTTFADVPVNITDDATGVAFPTSVTVLAGRNSTSFDGITVGVAANQSATITATLDGASVTTTFTILAATPASITLNPNALVGGQGFTGTVTGSGPANTSGYAISITHSGTEITTPTSVFMNGGASSVVFNGTTVARSTSVTHTVTATARGVSKSATLTINPGGLFGVTVAPTSIKGGTNAQGKIQTAGVAPAGGTLVAVSTDGPQITVPPTVTVDAGQQFKTFVVTSSAVSSTTPRTIIASFGTVIKTTTLTLTP